MDEIDSKWVKAPPSSLIIKTSQQQQIGSEKKR